MSGYGDARGSGGFNGPKGSPGEGGGQGKVSGSAASDNAYAIQSEAVRRGYKFVDSGDVQVISPSGRHMSYTELNAEGIEGLEGGSFRGPPGGGGGSRGGQGGGGGYRPAGGGWNQ